MHLKNRHSRGKFFICRPSSAQKALQELGGGLVHPQRIGVTQNAVSLIHQHQCFVGHARALQPAIADKGEDYQPTSSARSASGQSQNIENVSAFRSGHGGASLPPCSALLHEKKAFFDLLQRQ